MVKKEGKEIVNVKELKKLLPSKGLAPPRMITEEGNFKRVDLMFDAYLADVGRTSPSFYWDQDGIHKPANHNGPLVFSRKPVKYGRFICRGTLPDMAADATTYTDYTGIWFGMEHGQLLEFGSATFWWNYNPSDDTNELRAAVGGAGVKTSLDITDQLPSDYDTKEHYYWIKINDGIVEFYIDNGLAAVFISGTGDRYTVRSGQPFGVKVCKAKIPAVSTPFFEAHAEDKDTGEKLAMDFGIPVDGFRWTEGQPHPKRIFRLVRDQTIIPLTEGTYDSEITSHPLPLYGYKKKTMQFMADTDSTTDGLQFEVFTQERNWRVYDSRTYSANDLEIFTPSAAIPLMRVSYDPSATGASITEAEVCLQ